MGGAENDMGGKLLVAVQSLHEDGWARVRVEGRESSWFQVKSGVRQGLLIGVRNYSMKHVCI